jgi:hypothetical protein
LGAVVLCGVFRLVPDRLQSILEGPVTWISALPLFNAVYGLSRLLFCRDRVVSAVALVICFAAVGAAFALLPS